MESFDHDSLRLINQYVEVETYLNVQIIVHPARPSTYTVNVPPSSSSLTGTDWRYTENSPLPIMYESDASSPIHSFGNMALQDWVIKKGRTSGVTTGQVNRSTRTIKWDGYNNNRTTTEEWEKLLGLSGDFARPGDSGAFVVNERYELVGMLLGRDAHATRFNVGLVTAIGDIEEDLNAICGARFVLPP